MGVLTKSVISLFVSSLSEGPKSSKSDQSTKSSLKPSKSLGFLPIHKPFPHP